MKKQKLFTLSALLMTIFCTKPALAVDYIISFSATGASSSVSNIIVQNLTKGTSVTVPTGNALRLSDINNAVKDLTSYDASFLIYPQSVAGNYVIRFSAPANGYANISVYDIDGRKITCFSGNIAAGENSFGLTLPQGVFVVNANGNGYSFSKKVNNPAFSLVKADITQCRGTSPSMITRQKENTVIGTTFLQYTTGDLILYKGISGNYSTIVTDIPTASKTVTFNFVECKDANGNYYTTVKIGTKTWMAQNLRATKYRNGDNLQNITNNTDWGLTSLGSWCNYNNSSTIDETYGKIYNWFAASDSRNIAPLGWHVPTDAEWSYLVTTLGDASTSGAKLKETGTSHWTSSYTGTTNESGFSAVAGGTRFSSGDFLNMGTNASWWCANDNESGYGWYMFMTNSSNGVTKNYYNKNTGFALRCVKDADLPSLTTSDVSSVTFTSALAGGSITSDGGGVITAKGVCWDTSHNPTISNSKSVDGTGNSTFTSSLTGLTMNTTYYVRAYATTTAGTAYGQEITITTRNYDPLLVTDIDGNLYHTVTIGTQIWMVENLRTTRYNDGTKIPLVTVQSTWGSLSTPAYCWYNNDSTQFRKTSYGALYNWYCVNTGKLAPTGWHIPTDAEWTILTTFLKNDGGKLKSVETNYWTSPNTGATNESGFSGIPAGDRGQNNGTFEMFGNGAFWWSSSAQDATYAYFRSIGYNNSGIGRSGSCFINGLAIRCIKNTTPIVSTSSTSSITSTSVSCGGNVTDNGGEAVTEYGVCWSTSQLPTIADSKKAVGTGIGTFSTSITELTKSTTYYVRAYATNSLGTSYGEQKAFTTLASDPITVTDIDGNLYHTVTIGTQIWMVENLKTTRYRNGDVIGTTSSINQNLTYATAPEYQWAYNGQESNAATYGRLYTWYVVNDSRNMAPEGWHVASDAEWTTLQNFLIANGYNYDKTIVDNKIAKALSSTNLWSISSTTGTAGCDLSLNNSAGFSIVPAGYRGYDGYFYNMGAGTDIWTKSESSSTLAIAKGFAYSASFLDTFSSNKNYGFSVRCIKD